MASATDPEVPQGTGLALAANAGDSTVDTSASDLPADEVAEVTTPNVTAPAVEAAGLARAPDTVNGGRASATCNGPVRQVVVGFEPGIPLSGGEIETRALRVLERAFPKPCNSLTLKSTRREDLAPNIIKGQIDVGVLGVPAAGSHAAKGVTSLPAADTAGVDVVMLHPASYAVVSAKPTTTQVVTAAHTDVWLLLPCGLLAGLVTLAFSTYLLNFRLARGPDLAPGHTRIDPRLARLGNALHWMYAATSGRLLSLLWAALGAILTVQLASTQDVVQAALGRDWHPLEGAELAAYPGRDIYELRDGRWKKCPRPYKCLHNYEQKITQALAGDRDVLCRYEAQTHATLFEFVPDVAVPLLYALLLPSDSGGTDDGNSIQDVLLEALQHEPYSGSPFSPCTATITRVAGNE